MASGINLSNLCHKNIKYMYTHVYVHYMPWVGW